MLGCYHSKKECCDMEGVGVENNKTGGVSFAVALSADLIDCARCHLAPEMCPSLPVMSLAKSLVENVSVRDCF